MNKGEKHTIQFGFSQLERDSSDLFFANYPFRGKKDDYEVYGEKFGVKSINQVVFRFEQVYKWYLRDISDIEELFENFENQYRKFFKEETSVFSPLWIFINGRLWEFEFDSFISPMNFSLISEFNESYLINRNGENLSLSEHLIDLFRDDFKLFFILEDGESLESGDFEQEEIYPDLFFELKNKEYLNDQGFYNEIYQEIINQIFFE